MQRLKKQKQQNCQVIVPKILQLLYFAFFFFFAFGISKKWKLI